MYFYYIFNVNNVLECIYKVFKCISNVSTMYLNVFTNVAFGIWTLHSDYNVSTMHIHLYTCFLLITMIPFLMNPTSALLSSISISNLRIIYKSIILLFLSSIHYSTFHVITCCMEHSGISTTNLN
jgi:hypothetical protein